MSVRVDAVSSMHPAGQPDALGIDPTVTEMIKPFLYALQFLTRIPVPLREAPDPVMQGRMVVAYPLVGLMIGAMMAAVHFWLAGEGVGPALQAALVLAF